VALTDGTPETSSPDHDLLGVGDHHDGDHRSLLIARVLTRNRTAWSDRRPSQTPPDRLHQLCDMRRPSWRPVSSAWQPPATADARAARARALSRSRFGAG